MPTITMNALVKSPWNLQQPSLRSSSWPCFSSPMAFCSIIIMTERERDVLLARADEPGDRSGCDRPRVDGESITAHFPRKQQYTCSFLSLDCRGGNLGSAGDGRRTRDQIWWSACMYSDLTFFSSTHK